MLAGVPKQFLLLCGKPMLMHSLEAFYRTFPDIMLVVALPADHLSRWHDLCVQHEFNLPHQLVAGGETRFHSVRNALAYIGDDGVVAIHDGARPLISEQLIRSCFLTAEALGNCIPVIPMNESVRMLTKDASQAVDRTSYCIVQTPQVFHAATIRKAYLQEFRDSFTDDAVVAESMGELIHLTDGDPVNMKVTHPSDLATAETLMKRNTL